jgi:prepilin-type N-terminal cleavage/methylation domain-containing protein
MWVSGKKQNSNVYSYLKSADFQKAFTLVELIVVIVVLSILATISFLTFSNESSSARDTTRITDISNIVQWLQMFSATTWSFPTPDKSIKIYSWTTQIWYQWEAWVMVLGLIKISSWGWKDPLDNTYYTYNTNLTKNKGQMVWFLENKSMLSFNVNPFKDINQVFATDYTNRYPYEKWDALWIILAQSWTTSPYVLTPIQDQLAADSIFDTKSWSQNTWKVAVIDNSDNTSFPDVSTTSFDWYITDTWAIDMSWTPAIKKALTIINVNWCTACGIGEMLTMNNELYFTADDWVSWSELWKTDWTNSWTKIVKDITVWWDSYPFSLFDFNNTIVFSIFWPTWWEIWKTDWTDAWTQKLVTNAYSINTIKSNNKLFFSSFNTTYWNEPWVSDWTVVWTSMIKDIRSGFIWSNPWWFTDLNWIAYFEANSWVWWSWFEIWKTDWTLAWTVQIKKFPMNGLGISSIGWLTNIDWTIYFAKNDNTRTWKELWKSDWTAAWTVLIKDLCPSALNDTAWIGQFIKEGTNIYFETVEWTNWAEIWKTDWTVAWTILLKTMASTGTIFGQYTGFNWNLYFSKIDATNWVELWKSDWTVVWTTMLKAILPSWTTALSNFIIYNWALYFTLDNWALSELWKTDWTANGTVKIDSDLTFSTPDNFTVSNWALYFWADDATWSKLWKYQP